MKKIFCVLAAAATVFVVNNVSAEPNSMSIEMNGITFATLNTAVNGDQPNHLIDATISDGKYKGAKLHGKLFTINGKAGDPDRTSLRFDSMDISGQSQPVKITAYAIDANTAHTALNTKVTSEYLHNYGIILAGSFIQSYSKNPYSVKINVGTDVGVLFMSNQDVQASTFILKVTSDKPNQAFIGTYLSSDGLTYLNKKTPFETKISGKELRLMLGADSSNPTITVELIKQEKSAEKSNRLISKATGHSIYMCESNIRHNGKDHCSNVSILAY